MAWLQANWRTLLLAASLALNVLGGAGIVPPVLAKSFSALVGALPALPASSTASDAAP